MFGWSVILIEEAEFERFIGEKTIGEACHIKENLPKGTYQSVVTEFPVWFKATSSSS